MMTIEEAIAAGVWPTVKPDDDGIRPAGDPDRCFYCYRRVGELHGKECVCVLKRVKMRYVFELEVEFPYRWCKDDIEFNRNEGPWCADNAIVELEAARKAAGCLCELFTAVFVEDVEGPPIGHTKSSAGSS